MDHLHRTKGKGTSKYRLPISYSQQSTVFQAQHPR